MEVTGKERELNLIFSFLKPNSTGFREPTDSQPSRNLTALGYTQGRELLGLPSLALMPHSG